MRLQVFPSLAAVRTAGDDCAVAVSFLRVSAIGELTNDCLVADVGASGVGLRVREATGHPCLAEGGFYVEGLTRKVVADTSALSSAALDGLEMAEAIDRADGELQRGSRSHKLLIVTVCECMCVRERTRERERVRVVAGGGRGGRRTHTTDMAASKGADSPHCLLCSLCVCVFLFILALVHLPSLSPRATGHYDQIPVTNNCRGYPPGRHNQIPTRRHGHRPGHHN